MPHVKMGGVAVVCLLVFASAALASEITTSDFVHHYNPTLKVTRAPGKIKIDGHLNDPGWKGAQPATNFTEHYPGKEVKPPVRTEAFVTYDDDNFYLSAICYCDPATVRASMCEREQIWDDDNIGFFFDTYGDATRAYIININPYGIPYDALWSSGWGEDGNFDLIFESSGVITDSGYQVEMAIPFANLRFPVKPVQEWKIDFYRHHEREVSYSMSWATYDQDESCWPCQWGTITGIENVKPGKGIELLPSFVAHQSGSVTDDIFPDTSFANGDLYGDLSIGGKYTLASNIVLEATYNPDFSQIEADASQVDVNTTFALSYDEKRPFFQEGIELFRTNFNAVYTRSVNDPDFAAKGSARFGRTGVAVLSAHDEHSLGILPFEERSCYVPIGETYVNMMAIRHSFGASNHIRGLITDQRIDGSGSGTLNSLDAKIYLNKSLSVHGQFIATHTEEPDDTSMTSHLGDAEFDDGKHTAAFDGESFWGSATLIGMQYDLENYYLFLRVYQRTPTYRAANGFQPQNCDRRIVGNSDYEFKFEKGFIHVIEPGIDFGRIWNFDGTRKDEWIKLDTYTGFRFAQAYLWGQLLLSREQLGGIDFDNIWALTGETGLCPSGSVDLGVTVTYGNQIARSWLEMGRQTDIDFYADIRPTDRLLIEPDITYLKSHNVDTKERFFEGYVAHVRTGYQFDRKLSLRLVVEYNDFSERWSVDPLLTYKLNPFSTFYAGATYDYDKYYECGVDRISTLTCMSERQFFLKIQYLFQT